GAAGRPRSSRRWIESPMRWPAASAPLSALAEGVAVPKPIEVHKVAIESVSDASGLAELIDDATFGADDVLAVIGKTEGNGGVNDYTRILADRAFRDVLLDRGSGTAEGVGRVPLVGA